MKIISRLAQGAVAIVMLFSVAGCSGMSRQDKNTAVGAGIGAVGTLGGAAVGGIIGHEIKK